MKKLKLSQVKQICSEKGMEFLDEKYINSTYKHGFKCLKHQKAHNSTLKSIKRGHQLSCCVREKMKGIYFSVKHSIDEIKKISLESNIEFLDEEYEGVNHKHLFKCLSHNEVHKASFKSIQRGRKLDCCKIVKNRKSPEEIAQKLHELGLKLVDGYKNLTDKCLITCLRHNKTHLKTLTTVFSSKKGLPCCSTKKYRFKPKYKRRRRRRSYGQRRNSPEYREWKREIKVRDDFTCQVCNTKKLRGRNCVAHHMASYASNPKLRLDLENGVCMCGGCHKSFHQKYGFGENTKEQYQEFCFSFYKSQREKVEPIKKLYSKRVWPRAA